LKHSGFLKGQQPMPGIYPTFDFPSRNPTIYANFDFSGEKPDGHDQDFSRH
jgi:hypothetical protein